MIIPFFTLAVQGALFIDSSLGETAFQQGNENVNAALPGSLAGFAIYSDDTEGFDAARIEFAYDNEKLSIHKNLTRPSIPSDTYNINGRVNLSLDRELNHFEKGDGALASITESSSPGNYALTVVRRKRGAATEGPGLLCLAVFKLSETVSRNDTLSVGVKVTLSAQDGIIRETYERSVSIAITKAEISLLSPKSGDVLTPGEAFSVSWKSIHAENHTVNIDFSDDAGENWTAIAEDIAVSDGDVLLKAPLLEGNEARIRLTLFDEWKQPIGTPQIVPVTLEHNTAPAIIGEATGLKDGSVGITFSINDNEGDVVTVSGEYSCDGGQSWKAATLSGPRLYQKDHYNRGAVSWLSWPDLPAEYQQAVLLRITPSDRSEGDPLLFGPYTIDNTNGSVKGSFHRSAPGDVPILAFHNIEFNRYDNAKLSLTPGMFERIIEEFEDFGIETLSMKQYIDYIEFGKPIPKHSVLLTLDDGYRPLYSRLFPILKAHNCKASIGVITAKLNHSEYLSKNQVKIMHDSGLVDIQSHSWNLHRMDNGVSMVEQQRSESLAMYKFRLISDLSYSYNDIFSITGETPVAFITPYGRGNNTVEATAHEAGFRSMFYIGNNATNRFGDDKYKLNRLSMDRPMSKVAPKLLSLGYYSSEPASGISPLSGHKTEGSLPEIVLSSKLPGQVLFSSPAIGPDGSIYIGSWDKHLYCLDTNGAVQWSQETSGGIVSSPAVAKDGTVFAGSYDRYLYAYDQDGRRKWRLDCWDPVFSSPAVAPDGAVYIGSTDGGFLGGTRNGSITFNYRTGDMVISSPSIGPDGTIYTGTWNNTMMAFNPDGSLKWQNRVESAIESSPALGAEGQVYFGTMDGRLFALDNSGETLWSSELPARIDSSPVVGMNGEIYIGCSDGALYAFSEDGGLLWKYDSGGAIDSTPAIDELGRIYFGSRDGCIYALEPDGALAWRFMTGGFIDSSPTISPDGILYAISSDSYLYGFDIGSPLAKSSWPKFRGNIAQTGISDYFTQTSKPTVPIQANEDAVPHEFRLNAPFPNPFNPETVISYELPAKTAVTLSIYNASGQLVDTLDQGVMPKGGHSTVWNATDMPSGLYFITLSAGVFRATKKVTLMK